MEPHSRTYTSATASSQDIWYEPLLTATNDGEYVVYMLPGNPCIMTYYQPFLSSLFSLLNGALVSRHQSAHVGGYTPPGFRLSPSHIDGIRLPASLQNQIGYAEQLVSHAVEKHVGRENGTRPKVILLGHSAGTYITLEILRRYKHGHDTLSHIDIVGAVLICPTIVHDAESKNGRVANVRSSTIYYSYRTLDSRKYSHSSVYLHFRLSWAFS
jgi:pimeloyl-ACP methyl ester carboxylesterase